PRSYIIYPDKWIRTVSGSDKKLYGSTCSSLIKQDGKRTKTEGQNSYRVEFRRSRRGSR
ncbi:uncharacterized, partial [Tachysurus ichikawai]